MQLLHFISLELWYIFLDAKINVKVRLMLVLAPIACILSGIALSGALENYLVPKKGKKGEEKVMGVEMALLLR